MSSRKRKEVNRLDAFGEKTDLQQVADEIFGASAPEEFNTGRVVARPIAIDQIWADVRQPRRAIPASIRLVWNGNPADIPQLLQTWGSVAANAAGRTIDIQAIITGAGEGIDTNDTPPVYESFIALLRLAGSILRDGLINPISIIDQRDRHLIESGARRWLAYWLLKLNLQLGDQFSRIPAVIASGDDFVWRQAAENTARRSLNAVGMARQLALLIMDARGMDQYHDYADIVTPGGSDRRFYAQIADGSLHRIPKGSGERIQSAMGLSESQLAQYRRLLRITDDDEINDQLWLRADIEDWTENAFRPIYTFTVVKVREILSRDGWSLDDFRTAAAASPSPSQWGGARGGVTPPAPPPASPPRPEGEGVGGEGFENPNLVLNDIRQGFARVYALEGSSVIGEQVAANRATRLLNQAQGFYERNRMESARESLNEAFHIPYEAAAAADAAPPPTVGTRHVVSDSESSPGMSDHDIQGLLRWAWRWGKGHVQDGGWFTSQNCQQAAPSDLAELVGEDYLEQQMTEIYGRKTTDYRITPLGCRFLGAGFDVIVWDAAPPTPPHYEVERGTGGEVSDNAPSIPSGVLVVNPGENVCKILEGIKSLAQMTHQQDAADTASDLLTMTYGTARQVAETGQLADVIQLHYDNINNALSAWSMALGEFLENLNDQIAK